jgi:hypothetical protein
MKEKTVKDHEGKKHPADTARPGGAAYAPHNRSSEKLAEGTGDNRTPDKTIGERSSMRRSRRRSRTKAAEPQTSALEPERQGGISGPAEGTGDNRTPDKTIGEIKYAKKPETKQDKEPTGGAAEPQISALEPEKQGGISGP